MIMAIETVVTAISVGLQDTGPARQLAGRMFLPAVGGEVVEGRRRRPTAEGPVITQIGPEPGGLRTAFGQKRISSWMGCSAAAQSPT